jgi:hypothetical protein
LARLVDQSVDPADLTGLRRLQRVAVMNALRAGSTRVSNSL